MRSIKEMFFPGDEWLYFKIYTGIKTADTIAISALAPLAKKLKKDNLITKWFFIRYSDPDFHLRFRVMVNHKTDIGAVINNCNQRLKKYCADSLIWKIDISTYSREIQRYGEKYMEFSEDIFFVDSECILSLLSYFKKKDENYRWMIALKLIDSFFEDVGYDLVKRSSYVEKMNESYKKEFGYNMYNAKQLNNIYRERRPSIVDSLNKSSENPDLIRAGQIIKLRSKQLQTIIKDKILIDENISSYIHMSMNRLFRSQNRTHELLIYDFLDRHYKSEIARLNQKK